MADVLAIAPVNFPLGLADFVLAADASELDVEAMAELFSYQWWIYTNRPDNPVLLTFLARLDERYGFSPGDLRIRFLP